MSRRTDDNFNNFVQRIIDSFASAAKLCTQKVAENIVEDMRETGKPSVSPVQWDSEKQKKAYFATNGFGAGIPYRRTGRYEYNWKKTPLSNGWEVSAEHPAGAIGGTIKNVSSLLSPSAGEQSWQSKIHRGRWKSFVKTAARRVQEIPSGIISEMEKDLRNG